MNNPFTKRKKKLPTQVHTGIIVSNNNTINGSISNVPSSLSTINIGSYSYGSQGITGSLGIQGVTGHCGFGYSSAATFTYMDPEEMMKRRKEELMKEFEQNPELFSEIIVELRQRKIRQLKDKSQPQIQ